MSAVSRHPQSGRGPLRFGVLGCAEFAWRKTLPAMLAVDRIRLVCIGSRDVGRAATFAGRYGGEPVGGYDAVLQRDDVQAVYIPLPTMMHADWIERALAAGKHVLVEKPLTAHASRTSELLDAAASRGLVLMENCTFPYHSQHERVRGLLQHGAIGEIRQLSTGFTIPPRPETDNRYQPEVGGGALLDLGVYPIRAAVHFLGGGLSVVGAVLRRERARGVVISGTALLTTAGGVTVSLSFGMEHSYCSGYEFAGSRGRLSLDRAFTPDASHRPVVIIQRQDHREELVLGADDQMRNAVLAFTSAVLDGADPACATQLSRQQAVLTRQLEQCAVHIEF